MDFLNCALYFSVIGFSTFLLGRAMPKNWINADNFPFHTNAAEDRFYCRIHVRLWQNRLPDMSRAFPSLMPPKNLSGKYRDRLPTMIRETCVAELIHWLLAFLGFGCLRFCRGPGGPFFAFLFFFGNLPFIMIQRYNRPRLIRLLKRIEAREQGASVSDAEKDEERRKCEF